MKKLIVISILFLYMPYSYTQCVPNSIYQDSLFGLWPDTVQNLPPANAGVYYNAVVNIKTPTIVSEVVDPSQAYVNGVYIGNNIIDSITLVNVNGLPPGINLSCSNSNCSYVGDTVGCIDIFGTTNNIGQHPLTFDINGWIHISIFGMNIPFDLYGATGSYETITGYILEVLPNFNISYQTSNYNGFEISCYNSNDGTIDLTLPNSNNYTCLWVGPNGYSSTQMNISNLTQGTYTYTVTDNNGYSISNSITLSAPQAITITEFITNPSCFSANDGSVSLAISGGTSPYYQNWNGNDSSALSSGTYNYVVSDYNGCLVNASVTIIEPNQILVTENIINVNCNGGNDGQVSLTISGGTPTYTEYWGTFNPLALSSGTYNYVVTDFNGCTYSNNVAISEPIPLLVLDSIVDATTCYLNDGQVILSISGGLPPYNIDWNGYNPNMLYAGTYTYTIEDDNNCFYNNTISINNQNSQSSISPFTFAVSDYNGYELSCNIANDGSIEIIGLLMPLDSIGWLGPQNFVSNSQNNYNLISGLYSYSIVDSLGCNYSGSISLEPPDSISYLETLSMPSCYGNNDGEINLLVDGGAPPYYINWNGYNPNFLNAGTYAFSIIDNNGCLLNDSITLSEPQQLFINQTVTNPLCYNSSDGIASLTISGGASPYSQDWYGHDPNNLSAGEYYVEVLDGNNCMKIDTILIVSPPQITVIESISTPLCYGSNDGSVSLQINGGQPPYSQNWFGADSNALSAGFYFYEVSDSNFCIVLDSIELSQPSLITATKNISNPLCHGDDNGQVTLNIIGGYAPYLENWNGSDPNNLDSGVHYFSVVDSNGCFVYDSIIVYSPPDIQISLSLNNQLITGTASGGAIPFTFYFLNPLDSLLISNSNNMGSSLGFYPTLSGLYTLIVHDNNGCIDSATINFTELSTLIIDKNIKTTKELIRIVDLLGREAQGNKNQPLFYIYDDGTVEKRIVIE